MKIFRQLTLNIKSLQITLPAFALSYGVSHAAGSKKMVSLDNTDFVVLISFLIFVGVLIYFKVPSIVGAFLDKRSNDIQSEIEKAGEILEEAKKILSSIEADHIKTGETIEQMLENANWAPNHGKTEPWRFFVFEGDATTQFGKAHADLYKKHTALGGQRTWTCMVNLNQSFSGGYTNFPKLDLEIKPLSGQAILWDNIDNAYRPHQQSLHGGMPVEQGDKFILTQWFRQSVRG